MRIGIIGGGVVGAATAAWAAGRGHDVTIVEADPTRASALAAGVAPHDEPGLGPALRRALDDGTLRVASAMDQLDGPDIVFLCVGTPAGPDGHADLRQLKQASETLVPVLRASPGHTTVIVKSTVPPRTTRDFVLPILRAAGREGQVFGLAMNPEFIREGHALKDCERPDRVVYGTCDRIAAARLAQFYAGDACPVVATTPETAETIKLAANAMLATRVAFANETANLCERIGINVDDVMAGIGLDARIGPLFLKAGVGYGGSCFPKDLAAFAAAGRDHGVPLTIVQAVLANNASQPLRATQLLQEEIKDLHGKRVALLGLAFKAHTSDVRETRALPIYQALLEQGADVVCHDPLASRAFQALVGGDVQVANSGRDALEGADACILQAEWPEYRQIAPSEFKSRMRRAVIIDGRRWLDAVALREAGVVYRAVGIGEVAA